MMNTLRSQAFVWVACLTVLSQSCAVGPQATLTVWRPDQSLGNWDTVILTKLDGRSPPLVDQRVTLSPGKHKIVFRRSYMRGDMQAPIEVDVTVEAEFAPNTTYLAYSQNESSGLLGVLVAEEKPVPEGNCLRAGAFVYSSDYDLYQQKSEKEGRTSRRWQAVTPNGP